MNRKSKVLIVSVFRVFMLSSMILFSGCVASGTIGRGAKDGDIDVVVDFADIMGPALQRGSGFLHSFGVEIPPDETIEPLKPRLMRMRGDERALFYPGLYERVAELGATVQATLTGVYCDLYIGGDGTGYRANSQNWPGDNGNWTLWENTLEEAVLKAKSLGYIVEWDIWNEPDLGLFWKRSREQFFETWRKAVLKIREVDQDAIIVGPSISKFDAEYLKEFLLYARDNGVLPDVLSWHELENASGVQILHNREYIDYFMTQNGFSVESVSINEIIPPSRQFSPGTAVSYFANLERAFIDSATKSCWEESSGIHNAWNFSLDGLLTHMTFKPRAIWWAYKGYADITGYLAKVLPESNRTIDGVAGYDADTHTVNAVLGNWGDKDISDATIVFKHLDKALYIADNDRVYINVQRIPNTGTEPVNELEIVTSGYHEVVRNELILTIPAFKSQEAYLLKFDVRD